MGKIAVISTNNNNDYMFYLPVVVEGWYKLGYDVLLFTDGDCLLSKKSPLSKAFEKINAFYPERTAQIYPFKGITGIDSVMLTQCSRLFASYFVEPETRIITSDIDMLVLKDIFIDNGSIDTYGRDLTNWHYPMCYISMPSKRWREVMGISLSETLEENMERIIKAEPFHNSSEQWQRWGTDQEIITKRLESVKGFVFHHDRGVDPETGYPLGRLDRSGWRIPTGDIIDVHLPRDPMNNYYKIAPLCGDWFGDYFKSYFEL